jgi:hypothetical protein
MSGTNDLCTPLVAKTLYDGIPDSKWHLFVGARQEMAEYSLLDLDESVFISKYQLNVPSKERMTEFLRKENEGIYNKV